MCIEVVRLPKKSSPIRAQTVAEIERLLRLVLAGRTRRHHAQTTPFQVCNQSKATLSASPAQTNLHLNYPHALSNYTLGIVSSQIFGGVYLTQSR